MCLQDGYFVPQFTIDNTYGTDRFHIYYSTNNATLTLRDTSTGHHTLWLANQSSGTGDIRLHTSGADRLTVSHSGNVGIGTTSPNAKLDVNGAIWAGKATEITSYLGRAAIGTINGFSNYAVFSNISQMNSASYALAQSPNGYVYLNAPTDTSINFRINDNPKMKLNKDGNLQILRAADTGDEDAISIEVMNEKEASIKFYDENEPHDQWFKIGWDSSTPNRLNFTIDDQSEYGPVKLASLGGDGLRVATRIYAEEIIVESDVTADYVFDDDYHLMSIEEVEKYIDEHGHLPNVPGQDEVSIEGKNIGDTQTKLLEKIEELTLYLIAQNKENKQQSERIVELERAIKICN